MSSTSETRLARSAGTRPTSTVATSAVAKAKSTTGRLMPVSVRRGISAGLSATSVSSTAAAAATPRRPPAPAMSALSASSWRTRTPRPAPSAARTAISRRRDAPRAKIRPATLPHAISSTRTTAAISSHRVCRAGPKMKSSSGVTTIRKFVRSMRCWSATDFRYDGISRRASSTLTPGFSRPRA